MTDDTYPKIIARQWIRKAETALRTAEVLFREQLLVGCVNRMYYAAFYAVSAALAGAGKSYGKHTAVRAALHRDFVKSGIVPPACGKTYNRLFDDRQEGDYTPRTSFSKDETLELLNQTREFLDYFKKIVEA